MEERGRERKRERMDDGSRFKEGMWYGEGTAKKS